VNAFTEESLQGLGEFSHVDVVYVFDQPNRIGVCTCELLEVDEIELVVQGLDAIDGSPVLHLKPYMTEFAPRVPVRQPRWSHELMRGYGG
jgi:tRNA (Thr-GGU) A37 N-methylase